MNKETEEVSMMSRILVAILKLKKAVDYPLRNYSTNSTIKDSRSLELRDVHHLLEENIWLIMTVIASTHSK